MAVSSGKEDIVVEFVFTGFLLFLKVSVYLQNWSHVLSYVNKAESTPEIAEVRRETCCCYKSVVRLILK